MDVMTRPTPATHFEKTLRWYPATWRARYGDDLVAFMEDTYGDGRPPVRSRLGLARAGMVEHLADLGFAWRDQTPVERLRGGSLLVLCAWALFVIGGAIFAKATDNWVVFWSISNPHQSRWLPTVGFDAVAGAAALGAGVIAVGAACALPAFLRFLGAGRWSEVRPAIWRAVIVTAMTVGVGAGVKAWSQQLDFVQRNGGYWPYGVAFLVLGALIVATVVSWTAATLQTVRRLELPAPVLRFEGRLALLLALVMTVIISGTVVWWSVVAIHTPRFLSGSTSGPVGNPVPVNLLVAGLCMAAGLAIAVRGVGRVAGALRSTR
jgi:hypothetical protein